MCHTYSSLSLSPSNNHFSPANVVVVQSISRVQFFVTPWTAACQTSVLHYLLEFSQIHVHWVSDAIQSSHPLSSPPPLPSIFPSIKVFPSESALCIRWPKFWSFNFSIGPSDEYSGLISFRMDWLDLFVVQGTLKSSPAPPFKNISSSNEYSGLTFFRID